MSVSMQRDDGVSLHHRLSTILRSRILAGQISRGSALPGEHTLMSLYDVSRATVRRALLTLEQEGLVERRQGKPTVVSYDPSSPSASTPRRRPSPERFYDGTDVQLLERGLVLAGDDCRQALNLGPGSMVYQIKRLRWLNETPLWLTVNQWPMWLLDCASNDDLETATLVSTLRRIGRPPSFAEDRIGAVLADAISAPLLHVDVGAPLLVIKRTMMEQEQAPIAFQTVLVPPDQHQMAMRVQWDRTAVLKPFRAAGHVAGLEDS